MTSVVIWGYRENKIELTWPSRGAGHPPNIMAVETLYSLIWTSFLCLAGIRAKEARSPRRPSLLWPHGAHLSGWAHARADQTEGEFFVNFSLGQWFTILYDNVWFWLPSLFQVGGVDPKQLAVYEEFARNVPGFLPSNDLSQPTGFLAQPMKVQTPSLKWLCLVVTLVK